MEKEKSFQTKREESFLAVKNSLDYFHRARNVLVGRKGNIIVSMLYEAVAVGAATFETIKSLQTGVKLEEFIPVITISAASGIVGTALFISALHDKKDKYYEALTPFIKYLKELKRGLGEKTNTFIENSHIVYERPAEKANEISLISTPYVNLAYEYLGYPEERAKLWLSSDENVQINSKKGYVKRPLINFPGKKEIN